MAEAEVRVFRGYCDPLEVVDRTDVPFKERLAVLQDWQAALAEAGGAKEARDAVQGAIQALEIGSEVQSDEPAGAEGVSGYGVQRA